jgi:glycosyltransferase involved in cell wall biosynthesis
MSQARNSGKILFVVNDARFFVTHRLALARGIRQAGYSVEVAAPTKGFSQAAQAIQDQGFQLHSIRIERQGINPFSDLLAILQLVRLYRKAQPDIVHHVTVKPVVYGSIAARVARIPSVVNAISGLGRLFSEGSIWTRLRVSIVRKGYALALRHPNTVSVFQNEGDLAAFVRAHIVPESCTALVPGSGTELERFAPMREPESPPIVALVSRILRQKGVREFILAARRLRLDGTDARFVIVGDTAGNRDAVPAAELDAARREGIVEFWGWSDDMPDVMARASIVCLPSYHEGLPKALIDAAAAGRPIVATDIAGCRAVVVNGENGLLVAPRDHVALAAALLVLLRDTGLRLKMGRAGRRIAEARFDVALVVKETLAVYSNLEDRLDRLRR